MSDIDTKNLSDSEKLNMILAELADLKTWRAKVDAFIEDRSRDTRPKLDLIHSIVDELNEDMKIVKSDVREMKRRLETLAIDVLDVRGQQKDLDRRVSLLERNPS